MDPQNNTAQPLHPVYKERLQVKYLKATPKKSSLDISRWRFLNNNLDAEEEAGEHTADAPSRPSESRGEIGPVYLNSKLSVKTGGKARRLLSKEQACFSRQNHTQQTGRERVAAVERKLLQHPLVLFEHYQQSMAPELFEEVLAVLDPDMCVDREPKAPSTPDEHISKMSQGFEEQDVPLRETGKKKAEDDAWIQKAVDEAWLQKAVDEAWIQDPGTNECTAAETSRDSTVCPEELQLQNQTSNKEKRQMFVFQAYLQYLTSHHLRVPEFMSEIFSEEDEAVGTQMRGARHPGCSSDSKWTRANVK